VLTGATDVIALEVARTNAGGPITSAGALAAAYNLRHDRQHDTTRYSASGSSRSALDLALVPRPHQHGRPDAYRHHPHACCWSRRAPALCHALLPCRTRGQLIEPTRPHPSVLPTPPLEAGNQMLRTPCRNPFNRCCPASCACTSRHVSWRNVLSLCIRVYARRAAIAAMAGQRPLEMAMNGNLTLEACNSRCPATFTV
jgi:hypothetical protein